MGMADRIELIEKRISALVIYLKKCGYVFSNDSKVMPGPEHGTREAILEIETKVGACPESLKEFWEQIGSVDISGHHPDWIDDRYPDQLVVFPPSIALWELREFPADIEARQKVGESFEIPVAPDFYHKSNVSGGPPYTLSVPSVSADPPLNRSQVPESFLEHLERCLDCGGFPGMMQEVGHNWPLGSLILAASAERVTRPVAKSKTSLGASEGGINAAEAELGLRFPSKLRSAWLAYNCTSLPGGWNVFPVFDPGNPRKTCNSVTYENLKGPWGTLVMKLGYVSIADNGSGNQLVLKVEEGVALPVVYVWKHDTEKVRIWKPGIAAILASALRSGKRIEKIRSKFAPTP